MSAPSSALSRTTCRCWHGNRGDLQELSSDPASETYHTFALSEEKQVSRQTPAKTDYYIFQSASLGANKIMSRLKLPLCPAVKVILIHAGVDRSMAFSAYYQTVTFRCTRAA